MRNENACAALSTGRLYNYECDASFFVVVDEKYKSINRHINVLFIVAKTATTAAPTTLKETLNPLSFG